MAFRQTSIQDTGFAKGRTRDKNASKNSVGEKIEPAFPRAKLMMLGPRRNEKIMRNYHSLHQMQSITGVQIGVRARYLCCELKPKIHSVPRTRHLELHPLPRLRRVELAGEPGRPELLGIAGVPLTREAHHVVHGGRDVEAPGGHRRQRRCEDGREMALFLTYNCT